MKSKMTNFHDTKLSMIQSAMNEYINNKDGKKGMNFEHEQMQSLSYSLALSQVGLPVKQTTGLLAKIIAFFKKLFHIKSPANPPLQHYCYALLKDYVSARMEDRPEDEQQALQQLKYSECDPQWIKAMTCWFDYYISRMKKPMYIVYKNIEDYSYTFPNHSPSLKVALIGDWGTGEDVAETVLEQAFLMKPDMIIHLGDIYYSGTEQEYEKNFITPLQNLRKKHNLNIPVYNLPGNHDYYSGGQPFYDSLKKLNEGLQRVPVQEASYFAISNDYWHLQGMDTGFNDNDVLKVNRDLTELNETEIPWHQHHLDKAVEKKKKIILLSHHQLFSRYLAIGDNSYNPSLYSNFGKYIKAGQIAGWFWGHEHILEVYKPFMGLDKGRCVGHGAVPIFYENGKPYEEVALFKGKPLSDLPESVVESSVFTHDGDVYDRGFVFLDLKNDQTGKASYYQISGISDKAKTACIYEETL